MQSKQSRTHEYIPQNRFSIKNTVLLAATALSLLAAAAAVTSSTDSTTAITAFADAKLLSSSYSESLSMSSSSSSSADLIAALSVGQLKKALAGMKIDATDCLYKTDLQEKLQKAVEGRTDAEVTSILAGEGVGGGAAAAGGDADSPIDFSKKPAKMTLKTNAKGDIVDYDEDVLLVGNTNNPTHLVTMVHGLGDSANGIKGAAQMLSQQLPHTLFMVPNAPRQPVTINGGSKMNAWFDVMQMGGAHMTAEQLASRPTDVNGVLTSARYVYTMAGHIAHKHKIPTSKIIFGGFSQGGAMSIVAGLTAPYVARAVMPLSGFFPAAKEAIALATEKGYINKLAAAKVPFQFFHGDADPVLPLSLAKLSVDALKKAGLEAVDMKVYSNMGHTIGQAEMIEVVHWLKDMTK